VPEKRRKESEILSKALVELYLSLKGRTVRGMDEENTRTEEDFEKERKRLISFGNSALLGYIRTFSEIIIS
jgi:hypothetical protein